MPDKIIAGAWTAGFVVEKPGKEPVYYCHDHTPRTGFRELTAGERRALYGKNICVTCLKNLARLREANRSVCSGCYNNFYNYQSNGDSRQAPTTGHGCWHLDKIKRGKCPQRR